MVRLIVVLILATPVCAYAQFTDALIDSLVDAGATESIAEIAAGLRADEESADGNTALRLRYTHGEWRRMTLSASLPERMSLRAAGQRPQTGGQGDYAGAVRIEGRGPLEQVVLGGVRARFGESLALGGARSVYPAMRTGLARTSLTVTPNTSLWSPVEGAAATLRWGWFRTGAVAGREREGERRSQAWWVAGIAGDRGTLDVAYGHDDEGATVTSLYAGLRTADVAIAAEVALRATASSSVRLSSGGRLAWAIDVYDRDRPASGPFPGLSETAGRERGGGCHFRYRSRGITARASAWGSTRAEPERRESRRRVELALSGSRENGDRWRAEIRRTGVERRSDGASAYTPGAEVDTDESIRIRASYTVVTQSLQHEHRLELYPDQTRTGLVATWRMKARLGIARLATTVSAYDLVGETPVVPAGVHGLDSVSVVSGVGADVSVRLTLVPTDRASVGFYASRSGRRDGRVYFFATVNG